MKGKALRSYLLAGMVVWIPILVTFLTLRFIVEMLDETIALLPSAYQPQQLFGFNIPGLGVILSLVVLIGTGLIATNFFGARLVSWSESILDRIPLVRSIYNGTKQIMQAIISSNSQAFRQVLLVEYPRKGIWTLAFQTADANAVINQATEKDMIAIFIPTTPNPTAGFLLMVPKEDTIELPLSADEALKMIISLGVMQSSKKLTK